MDEEDEIGFNYFLTISYTQHKKDFPDDKIEFHDFSSICMNNWESLDEETKKKIIELAKKEKIDNEIKKERKPNVNNDSIKDEIIAIDDSTDDENEAIVDDFLNVNRIIEIAESIKKFFGKHYTFCKKPRSAYIYFVKAARIYLKDRIQCSKDNFIEISKAISSKWNEMKIAQRKVFEDLALLDKRFNGFRIEAAAKKKNQTITTTTSAITKHTPLFLKAKAEASEHHASTSNGTPIDNLRNLLAARRARKDAERAAVIASSKSSLKTTGKRKTKRKKSRAKKKKTKSRSTTSTSRSTTIRRLPSTLPGAVKMERMSSIKKENKFKVKKEIKLKREF